MQNQKACIALATLCLIYTIFYSLNIAKFEYSSEFAGLLNVSGILSHSSAFKFRSRQNVRASGPHIILFWTTWFGYSLDWFGNPLVKCPHFPCVFTANKSLQDQASAFIYHIRDFSFTLIPNRIRPEQYNVFLLHEAPVHTYADVKKIHGFFNLTLSYRLDSDAPMPYGFAARNNSATWYNESDVDQIIAGKNKTIAWIASNCGTHSKREKYVAALNKKIPVEIYGSCGNHSCHPRKSMKCNKMIERDYYFHLAFENGVCNGYITEKFWDRVSLHVVPIVLKRSIYIDIAPPNSFIAVDDYPSVGALAEYLKFLMNNTEEYKKYFEWKRNFDVYLLDFDTTMMYSSPQTTNINKTLEMYSWCKLCATVASGIHKQYDMEKWWHTQGRCAENFVKKYIV